MNPSVKGKACIFCGAPAQSFGHFEEKGMGGLGSKADPSRDDGAPMCGTDHVSQPDSCHYGVGNGYLVPKRMPHSVHYRVEPTEAALRWLEGSRLHHNYPQVLGGIWYIAPHTDTDFDAIDAPREEVMR